MLSNTSSCDTQPHCRNSDKNNVPPFSKAVILIIDALKYDFAVFNDSKKNADYYENQLPVISRTEKSGKGALFEFLADPPTTTMQRLKGLTTGSLPTFIDVSSNFGSYDIKEDNIVDQLLANNKTVIFAGDDTWMSLFPDRFSQSYPFPSFDVWDLDTVDTGVSKTLKDKLSTKAIGEWDVLIAHYLGVDHAGHKHGPRHPEMRRKLNEMNDVIEKVISKVSDDTIVFVMGDHGMTQSGDHGGDSRDEVSAALFVYANRYSFKPKESIKSVSQVDFVPTLSLLLGIPIPFSNLGKFIPELMTSSSGSSSQMHQLLNQVAALKINVDQVFSYLNAYDQTSRGKLPQSSLEDIRGHYEKFQTLTKNSMGPDDLEKSVQDGLNFLDDVKNMCRSVWVEFDLNSIVSGIAIFLLQLILGVLLTSMPKNCHFTRILSSKFLFYLWIAFAVGMIGSVILQHLQIVRVSEDKKIMFAFGCGLFASTMIQGYTLLWRLRGCISQVLAGESSTQKNRSFGSWFYTLTLVILTVALFSNSYVVDEASVLNFSLISIMISWLWYFRKVSDKSYDLHVPLVLTLVFIGLLRLANVYFRCREEQMGYCLPTEFHKTISTLPKDASYKFYKDWRFFCSIASVILTVGLPHTWLKLSGNLNGYALTVYMASFAPWIMGLSILSFWALQGHAFGSKLVPWQQNSLAQYTFGMFAIALLICICQPRLLYLVHHRGGKSLGSLPERTHHDYFGFIRSNWRHFTTSTSGGTRKVVFGIGTALSAPVVFNLVLVTLVSMLVLGDGLCPSLFLALLSMIIFLVMSTAERLRRGDATTASDLLNVPLSAVIGWWLLEAFFFFATGHQPTFPTIQWGAAFVGFSGDSYGDANANALQSFVLPALLIGWNTFVNRILFALALPLLLVAPFTLWIWLPMIRRYRRESSVPQETETTLSATLRWSDLEQGEMAILECAEEARAQMFNLYCKYLVLQAFRVAGTMISAAILRRHLMVWKIFAPRFIFEAVGFSVSVVISLVSFCIFSRTLTSLVRYYRLLEKDK